MSEYLLEVKNLTRIFTSKEKDSSTEGCLISNGER